MKILPGITSTERVGLVDGVDNFCQHRISAPGVRVEVTSGISISFYVRTSSLRAVYEVK